MTLEQIISVCRRRLDDEEEPYRWSDDDLCLFANEAEREACRRAHLIIDKTTDAVCRQQVIAGNALYTLNAKIIRVRDCYIGPFVRGTLSWVAASRALVDTGNRFLTAGFQAADRVVVSRFPSSGNNGLFSVESVTAGEMTVAETGMVDETVADIGVVEGSRRALVKRTSYDLNAEHPGWEQMVGDPRAFLQEEDRELRLVPIPREANTLRMVVSRLPVADMALATRNTTTPEISEYHYDLLDWMCHLAYLKDDADTQDLPKAKQYEDGFTAKFGSRPTARTEQFRKKYPREIRVRYIPFGF